jgi:hypothetical protein
MGEEQNVGTWYPLHDDEAKVVWTESPPCCGKLMRHAACHPSGPLVDMSYACTCSGLSRSSYAWRPKRCTLLPWNATRFCDRLGPRALVFIGDSTVSQHWAMLANMIVWDGDEAGSTKLAACAARVRFVPSDTLTMVPSLKPAGSLHSKHPMPAS